MWCKWCKRVAHAILSAYNAPVACDAPYYLVEPVPLKIQQGPLGNHVGNFSVTI